LKSYAPDEFIFRRNEIADKLYFVVKGSIQLSVILGSIFFSK